MAFLTVGNGKRGFPFPSISKDLSVLGNGGPFMDRAQGDESGSRLNLENIVIK